MAYALETARTELKRVLHWLTRTVSMEPLEGLADGTNRIFHLPVVPASDAAVPTFYDTDGATVAGASVLDYEYGAVRFASGSVPTTTVYASYTAQAMTDTKLLNLCLAGFDEMESRYRRSYYVVTDTNNYVSSTASPTITDPPCGGLTFSTSRVQIALLLACIERELIESLQLETALTAYSYREERVGGLSVDKKGMTSGYDKILADLDDKINDKIAAAREEMGATESFGAFIAGAQSDTFADVYDWWPTSDQATGG